MVSEYPSFHEPIQISWILFQFSAKYDFDSVWGVVLFLDFLDGFSLNHNG